MNLSSCNSQLPLASVIVPSYCHEKYVTKCLESIASQSYSNIELIVVDDCSIDKTFDCVVDFANNNSKKFKNVNLKRNSVNLGAHNTLNRGIRLATGEFIFFMNSDDTYHPDRLSTMIDKMQETASSLAFSACLTIDEDDRPYFNEDLCHHIYWRPFIVDQIFPSTSWGVLWRQISASTGNIVVTKDLLDKVGFFRDLKYCHDWDFMLRCIFYSEPLFVPDFLYNYRVYGENSFRSLSCYARKETEFAVGEYIAKVENIRPINRLAPAPSNWPGSYYNLLGGIQMDWLYSNLYNPYNQHHRTIDKKLIIKAHSTYQDKLCNFKPLIFKARP